MIHRLEIKGMNLNTNEPVDLVLIGSNMFKIAEQYSMLQDIHINSWMLTNEYEAGNTGMNAGACLCEHLEGLTNLDLS